MNIPFGITTFCGKTVVNLQSLCSSEEADEIRQQYPDLVIWQGKNDDCYRFQGYLDGFEQVSHFLTTIKVASNNVRIARLQADNENLLAPYTVAPGTFGDPFEWEITDPDELPF